MDFALQLLESRTIRRFALAGLLAGSLQSAMSAEQLPSVPKLDGPEATAYVNAQVSELMASPDYDTLTALVDELARSKSRFADGRWRLAAVGGAWETMFGSLSDPHSARLAIADWRRKAPKSAAGALAEAQFWESYAWMARGAGPAHTVQPEAWRLFHERLVRAEAALLESKPYASGNPLWYQSYLSIGRGLGWSHARQLELFREAVDREPEFQAHYFQIVFSLTPRWGGDYRMIAPVANEAVRRTRAREGESMYARVYWTLAQFEADEIDLFGQGGASWTRMKRGFDDLMARYPDSDWNLVNFAAFACRADDKETYLRLRPKIDPQAYPKAWPANFSVDLCDRRLVGPA